MLVSLAVVYFSVVGIGLVVGVVRVRRELGIADVVDGVGCCGEAFLVERAGDESGYTTPVPFWLGEYGARAYGRTLSVVLLSAIPALTRADCGHPWCQWIGVLLIGFRMRVCSVPRYYLRLIRSEAVWRIGVMWESKPD